MPRAKVGMETYPEVFWNVLRAAEAGQDYSIAFPAKNQAINTRHRFHYFRRDLIKEQFPGAVKMTSMICSLKEVEGKWVLHFANLDAILGNPQAEEPILPTIIPLKRQIPLEKQFQGEDGSENAMRAAGYLPEEKEPTETFSSAVNDPYSEREPCQHEWGYYPNEPTVFEQCSKCTKIRKLQSGKDSDGLDGLQHLKGDK